jgi:outer membrane protein assembly factor BamB
MRLCPSSLACPRPYQEDLRGRLHWAYTTGGPVESSPAVVGGTVYIGSDPATAYGPGQDYGKVYALNAGS